MNIESGHSGAGLGRRIKEHRNRAGLSRGETAARAGMATSYLEYLETSATPDPTRSALARLASALGTSTRALSGDGPGLPAPRQRAPGHPVAGPLTPAQCRDRLGTKGVGRFLFVEPRGPVAIPVNYAMLGDDIVIRAAARTCQTAGVGQSRVSFEVDHIEEDPAEGWSVLVSGDAHVVTAAAELAAVTSLGIAPWAGDDRDSYVRIVPADTTGRRIHASP
jgi:transcriptional regulator with XRE-family HTH domain